MPSHLRSPAHWGAGCLVLILAAVTVPCALAFSVLCVFTLMWNSGERSSDGWSDETVGVIMFLLCMSVPSVFIWIGCLLLARGGPAPATDLPATHGEGGSLNDRPGEKPLEYDY